MNETTLAMCATLEIAAHERALLRETEPSTVRRVAPTQDIAMKLTGFSRGLQTTMPKLAAHGIVVGVKGRRGGHRLAKPESEITLLDIFEAVEKTNFEEVTESFSADIPSIVQWVIGIARRVQRRSLASWTLASALDEIEAREAIISQQFTREVLMDSS